MIRVKKRGQGEVVTTVLLVLLVLAAIALITPFLLNFLQKGAKSVTAACLELQLQPISCVKNGATGANVTYKWASGEVNLTGVKVIIEQVGGSSKVFDGPVLAKLETKSSNMLVTDSAASKFTVAGVVMTEGGGVLTCPENPTKVTCN